MKKKKTSIIRHMAVAAISIAVMGLSYVGWSWMDDLVVHGVEVEGARHADEEAILAMARVDSGGRLLDVDPTVIADRTLRHPWVSGAHVRRRPPGTVRIEVVERTPVALALGPDGTPTGFLDAHGYVLPIVDGAVYDVPLLRGVTLPEHPSMPIDATSVRNLLASFEALDPRVDALLSTFEVSPEGEIMLHTAPAGTQGSVEVRLGTTDFEDKFKRLNAFWTKAVLTRPERMFDTIDLRFDSQIVTRES